MIRLTRRPWRRLSVRRPPLPIFGLITAALVSLAVALPSFFWTAPVAPPIPAAPTLPAFVDEGGIAPFIDLGSLGITVSHGRFAPPSVNSDAARRIALATPSAAALLPVQSGRAATYRVVVNTITPMGLSGPQWTGPCDCWILTLGVDPEPPLSLACVASNPPVGIEEAVVVIDGHVVGVEDIEGTDGFLARIAALREGRRIRAAPGRGVLVKEPKRGQDLRFDLPTIGPRTVEGAARAGLAGIAVAAGNTLLAEPQHMIEAADRAGLFVTGVPA